MFSGSLRLFKYVFSILEPKWTTLVIIIFFVLLLWYSLILFLSKSLLSNESYIGVLFSKSATIYEIIDTTESDNKCVNDPVISVIRIIPVIGALTIAVKYPAIEIIIKLLNSVGLIPR